MSLQKNQKNILLLLTEIYLIYLFGINFNIYSNLNSIEGRKIDSLCNLTRESFGVEDISNNEVLERLDSSIIILPEINSNLIGFISIDIINFNYESKNLFGNYLVGAVIKNKFQNKGLYSKIYDCLISNKLDYFTTRTQNKAIYNSFIRQYPNSVPNKVPNSEESKLGKLIANYLNCEDKFNSKSFICHNVYEGIRNNAGLIEGLSSTDAYILLNLK